MVVNEPHNSMGNSRFFTAATQKCVMYRRSDDLSTEKNRIKVTELYPPFILTVDGKQQQQAWRLKNRVSLKDVLIACLESDNDESVLEIDSDDFLNEDSL